MPIAILLHNIRSAHNVGSIFRTADAAGVAKIYLCGYTPVPIDRFGRPQKEIAKTALGAARSLPWEYFKSPVPLISKLSAGGGSSSGGKKQKWGIVGVEQDRRSRDYRKYRVKAPTLFIFGNEVRGLSHELRAKCDVLIEIPMHGKKESLNVSVAAGIVLFQMLANSH